jgi:hypothetical protein
VERPATTARTRVNGPEESVILSCRHSVLSVLGEAFCQSTASVGEPDAT